MDGPVEKRQLLVVEHASSAMSPDELRVAVKAAAEAHQTASLTLSSLLRRVRDERLYKQWQYATFGSYVRGELGLDVKHAESLVRVERVLIGEAGVPRQEAYALGLAKALALLKLVTQGLFVEPHRAAILTLAKSSSVSALKRWVRGQLTAESATPHDLARRRLVFLVTAEQATTVDQALAIARIKTGLESRGSVLAAMCQAYLASQTESTVTSPLAAPVRQPPPRKIASGRRSSNRQVDDAQLSFLPEMPHAVPDAPVESTDTWKETDAGLTPPVDPRLLSVAKPRRSTVSRKGQRTDPSCAI